MKQSDTIFDEEMFDDADTLGDVKAEGGKQLSGLVRQLNNVQQQIDDAEEHLKALKQEKQRILYVLGGCLKREGSLLQDSKKG